MEKIDVYNNRFSILKNIDKRIYVKFIVMLILVVLLMVYLMTIEYPRIYKVEGFVSGDKIVVPVKISDLEKLKGNELKIDNVVYRYSVLTYEYLNETAYYSNDVLVTLSIDRKFKTNQVVSILIEDGNTNLYKSFIKKIWKGF